MKKLVSGFLAITFIYLMSVSCEKQKKENPPELPSYESMAIDFSKFKVNDTKSAYNDLKSTQTDSMANYHYAQANVGIFSFILAVTLAVPVTTFINSFSVEPVFLGDATWQWSTNYDVLAGTYHARLTGEVASDSVIWIMHVSRTGAGAFDEFTWFDGTSSLDGTGGKWLLYHSQLFPEPMLTINWKRTGDEVGWIKYEVVRELNDDRSINLYYGSYIEAELSDAPMNASYNIHVYDIWTLHDFADVNIEWSTSEYYGHVKSPLHYLDDAWHCWDSYGYDITCE